MKLEDLKKIKKKETKVKINKVRIKAVVGMGTCGIPVGANDVYSALLDEINKRKLTDVKVIRSGYRGLCGREPLMDVYETEKEMVTYGYLTPQKVRRNVAKDFVNRNIVKELQVSI